MFTRVTAVQPPSTTVATGQPSRSNTPGIAAPARSLAPQRGQVPPPAAPSPRDDSLRSFRLPPVWSPREPNRTGLPDRLKHNLEQASGLDLSDVRVHRNSSRTKPLGALAYTQGRDIHLGPGQERHLPHELWHVVQQKQGRVRPTLAVNGTAVNDDRRLEAEATAMAGKGARTAAAPAYAQPLRLRSIHGRPVVQRMTAIQYNNNAIPPNAQINAVNHQRRAVHGAARNWVLANSEINQVPANTVCNHARAYQTIWQNLHGMLAGTTIDDAADTLLQIYGNLNIGGNPGNHANVLQASVNGQNNAAGDLNDAFNYYIYKIGDYPSNLFFWPDRTGGNPDAPRTVYTTALPPLPLNTAALPLGWAFSNPLTADAQRLTDEQNRVVAGTADLTNEGL